MTDLEKTVTLTHQSFREAGGHDVYPDLVMTGIVVGNIKKQDDRAFPSNLGDVNNQLIAQAQRMGATHVFGVQYRFRESAFGERYGDTVCGAVGTAYKPPYSEAAPESTRPS